MFSKVKWRKWKTYSGPMIRGTIEHKLSDSSNHWERIIWLTAQVETGGRFGATTCYDGTGNTSGLIQAIAVYPKELAHEDNNPADDQGALWKMLEYIRDDCPTLLKTLDDEFSNIGWIIKDGYVRHIKDEKILGIVNGNLIRNEFTPDDGVVPKWGAKWIEAKNWAIIFNDIFSDPKSFDAQIRFGIDHTKSTAKKRPFILKDSIENIIYDRDIRDTKLFTLDNPMDLAMSVLFSNSVNAPAMAFRNLKGTVTKFGRRPNWQNRQDREVFAKLLLKELGTADYARWNFKIADGRYQRTRDAAITIWPAEFFNGPEAIMPRRF